MVNLFEYGGYVSWDHCIEATNICNLEACPETMDCCLSNCMGIPTIKGMLLCGVLVFMVLVVMLIIRSKDAKEQQGDKE